MNDLEEGSLRNVFRKTVTCKRLAYDVYLMLIDRPFDLCNSMNIQNLEQAGFHVVEIKKCYIYESVASDTRNKNAS